MEKVHIGDEEVRRLALLLKNVDFFSNLSVADMDKVLRCVQLYLYPKNRILFKKGSPGDAFYLIDQGKVEISTKKAFFLPSKVLISLGNGEFFGEMALVDEAPRSATAKTIERSRIFVLLKSDFEMVFQRNSTFQDEMKRIVKQRKFHSKHLNA